jgi:hypothetical protein
MPYDTFIICDTSILLAPHPSKSCLVTTGPHVYKDLPLPHVNSAILDPFRVLERVTYLDRISELRKRAGSDRSDHPMEISPSFRRFRSGHTFGGHEAEAN